MANMNDIITLPHISLRQPSSNVEDITPAIKQLVADMEDATLDWEDHRPHEIGVALAAVQVNHLKRIVVVRNDFDDKDDRTFFTLINPEVIKAYGNIVYDFEGCLSVQDVYGKVPRYNKVKVKALDLEGKEVRLNAEGFLARVLQHEIDHTHGTLFVDHIKDQDVFYRIDDEGQLVKLDYDEAIAKNTILWERAA